MSFTTKSQISLISINIIEEVPFIINNIYFFAIFFINIKKETKDETIKEEKLSNTQQYYGNLKKNKKHGLVSFKYDCNLLKIYTQLLFNVVIIQY